MQNYETYFDANKKLWDQKTQIHVASDFYDNEAFLKGQTSLPSVDIKGLGDIKGKKILHLQCHFGQDSLSMARMGADVTAVDLSHESILQARKMKDVLGLDCTFVECNVYDTALHIDDTFDIVYTSYGTITWLPDLHRWASVVASMLKPGGHLYMVEFHPHLHTYDWTTKQPAYGYFNKGVYHEVEAGTYAEKDADISLDEYFWIHPIADIMTGLLENGLQIKQFSEHDYSPYNCFDNMIERAKKEYVFDLGIAIPHMFEIKAEKVT